MLKWISCRQVAFSGYAHYEERLKGHHNVLWRVPHVRIEQNERLVLQVKVKLLQGRRVFYNFSSMTVAIFCLEIDIDISIIVFLNFVWGFDFII